MGSNGRGPSLCLGEAQARRAHGAVGVLHPPGEPVLRPGLATTDDVERGRYKFLWEVIRIDICERLVEEWYHINVQAAAEAS